MWWKCDLFFFRHITFSWHFCHFLSKIYFIKELLCCQKYGKAQMHAFVTKLWWKHDSCKNICIFLIYPKLLKNKFVLQIWTHINSIRYFNNFWSLFQVVISVNKHSIFIKWYPFGNHLKDLDALKNNKLVFWWCIFNFVDVGVPELTRRQVGTLLDFKREGSGGVMSNAAEAPAARPAAASTSSSEMMVLPAKEVHVLLHPHVRVSRNVRAQWLLTHYHPTCPVRYETDLISTNIVLPAPCGSNFLHSIELTSRQFPSAG